MPILQDLPLQITVDGLDSSLNQLRQRLELRDYPNTITVTHQNTRNFIRFTEHEADPNKYNIEAGNNPDGFGRRHAMASCNRDKVKDEIMHFFAVDQFGGRRKVTRRKVTRRRRASRRNLKK
jgi:hypothetical protein